jgi:putative nucleotidyltransferase with HDIG domain
MYRPFPSALAFILVLAIFNFITIVSFLYFGTLTSDDRFLRLGMMFIGSIVSATITVGVVFIITPVLRDFLITFRRLLRFDSLSHPLLVRLATEAPGTYHHSLMIATLAHRVAKAIGADPILTRIGAYYHDVGKLKDPELFVENQRDGKTPPAQNIDYEAAAKAIMAHVEEGLKLAKEHNLPPEITAFIPQHHGTSVMRYFYDRAHDEGKHVKMDDFRYQGPKPLSLETALVMLADAIEARVRAVGEFTRAKIQEIVQEVIEERVADKQLELASVNETLLNKISRAFVEAELVVHHRRLKYPADLKKENGTS